MESQILLFIQNNIRNPILDCFFLVITHLGDAGIIWILFSIVLIAIPATRKTGFYCGASLLVMLVLNNLILKNIVARTRPYEVIEGLVCLVGKMSDYSFPSGHTSASFAVVTALFVIKKKQFWIPSLILAILIAFSRLYVGVHWPTDVLGGIFTGVAAGISGWFAVRKTTEKI